MIKLSVSLLVFFLVFSATCAQEPISLHPGNPHYFLFRGKPVILISSAEHYGAVLNADVDYKKYLTVLEQSGLNQTRIFSGSFCEGSEHDIPKDKEFVWDDIQNTLSPRPGKFISPWARSDQPGYIRGGNKFDLDKWDEQYFTRLKDFLKEADSRNIIEIPVRLLQNVAQ